MSSTREADEVDSSLVQCNVLFDGDDIELLQGWSEESDRNDAPLALIEGRVRGLIGFVRRELGLAHFAITGLELAAVITSSTDKTHEIEIAGPEGSRRIGFVVSVALQEPAASVVSVRVFDSIDDDDPSETVDSFIEVPLENNSAVFFKSDRHVEFRGVDTVNDETASRIVIMGSIIGEPVVADRVRVVADQFAVLRQRYLPKFTDSGFEVRATPEAVQRLLESVLEIRSASAVVDASGRSDLAALSDDAVDISAFRNDILRGLRIVHEKFAGVQLVAEQVVGLQIFSSGERIPSHYGRLGIDVITSVIQVAEDVDEPWPFVLERDGRTDDVYLGVGQMLLLESSTVSRARPIPLNGRSVITLMTSFRPLDWPWSEDAIIDRARVDGLAIGVDRREVRPTI